MGERRGTKALELWCRRITEGYPGVNVQNMTTSWRDGLAFCAMIHHFRPDIMDFDSLDKDDIYGNNELAFRIAEQHLGIPALLDAEDMTSCAVPDRLSILTYLSQFYQTFGGSSPSRLALKRTTTGSDERIGPVTESPQPKIEARLGTRRDPCVICGLPVFLAEKLVISRALYHRTCFRCARCNNQLTPGNYYETEEDQYCCETCPDEEATSNAVIHQAYTEISLADTKKSNKHSLASSGYQRSLSDEEKSERQGLKQETVSYNTPKAEGFIVSEPVSQTAQLRLNFMTSHLLLENELSLDNDQSSISIHDESSQRSTSNTAGFLNEWKCINPKSSSLPDVPKSPYSNSSTSTPSRSLCFSDSHISSNISTKDVKDEESNTVCDKLGGSTKDSLNDSQQLTAISPEDVNSKNIILNEDTKDTLVIENKVTDTSQCLSLVQQKLKIFENNDMRVKKKSKVCEQIDFKNIIEKPNPYVYTSSNNKEYVKNVERADDINLSVQALQISQVAEHKESDFQEKNKVDSSKALAHNVISCESERPRSLIEDETLNDFNILNKTIDDKESQVVMSNMKTANVLDEDISVIEDYPEDLNPFKNDENDSNEVKQMQMEVGKLCDSKILMNPFDSSDDEVDSREVISPQPAIRGNATDQNGEIIFELPVKRRLEAPQISLNPFWSDGEEHSSDLDNNEKTTSINMPVPKPRTLKQTPEMAFVRPKANLDREGVYASNSSIISSGSTTTTPGGTHRKKKPAPQPPAAKELFAAELSTQSIVTTDNNVSSTSASFSPHTSRMRKAKPAPPPPMCTNTSYSTPDIAPLALEETSVTEINNRNDGPNMWEDQKNNKDETNRNRQSLFTLVNEESQPYTTYTDKSAQGKWKRKKGPAPPCPMPYRRKIKVMSIKDVKLELDEIELQQQGLEKQGVHLERLIRDKCESGQPSDDSCLNMDVEELVLELFALVNEKNELFRRQAELMLLGRQQRLEEEHAEIEYQIRCLMCQPEATKTDFNKQREEALIQRLVEIVEKRNEIVECLEMDRRREVEEDRSIHRQMGLFAAKNKSDLIGDEDDLRHSSKIKKGKVKEKTKEKKSKKSHKKDADKDVDETEVKLKRHKKKWF